MKRLLPLLLLFFCLAALVACTNDPATPPQTSSTAQTSEPATTEPEIEVEHVKVEVPYKYAIADGKVTLLKYTGNEADVVIPSVVGDLPVVALGEMAFAYNTTLKTVEIPGSLTETGNLAFYSCTSLEKVKLNEGTVKISLSSFNECTALKEIAFPSTLTDIGFSAFKGCISLTAVNLEGIALIDDAAFCHTGLTEVYVPNCVKTVGSEIFMDCPELVKVDWHGPANIREKTFAYCYKLKDVSLYEYVYRIYDYCFARCLALEELVLPPDVQRFYSHALYGCTSLKTVRFTGASLQRVSDMAFHFLPALTDIYYAGTEAQWKAIEVYENNEGLTLPTVHFGA